MLGVVLAALTLSLAVCYVMLLPLEVALQQEESAAVPLVMTWVWPILLTACMGFAVVLVPFGITWYDSRGVDAVDAAEAEAEAEAADPAAARGPPAARKAAVAAAVSAFVFVAVFFVLWVAIGTVYVTDEKGRVTVERVPWTSFLVALTTGAGWVVFFLFCGVGLAAVPVEGVRAFLNRPRFISSAEYEMSRARIHSATTRLLESGRALDAEVGARTPSRSQHRRLLAFRQQVQDLDTLYRDLEMAYRLGSTSVLRQYVKLCLSLVAALLSVAWVLQLILHDFTHAHSFLNVVLVAMDGLLPLLGSALYAVMAFYLVWCTVFGCLSVAGNLSVFPVFAMPRGETVVNALLFNALLTMLAAMAALHLCATSFDVYATDTSIAAVFSRYVNAVAVVSHVVRYLRYALVVVSMASVLWLLLWPKRRLPFATDASDEEDPLR